jgi:hypothetical protein
MSKVENRRRTGNFLQNSQGMSSFRLYPQQEIITGSTLTGSQTALTGAIEPILPMRIVTVSKTGRPIDFTLLINPESWNHAKTNVYQSVYTRAGWSVQLWGPNQDTISSIGKSAAMMNSIIGLDSYMRQTPFAYLNLVALVSAYKTNGYEFYDRIAPDVTTRVINRVRGVHLIYDGHDFMGHFSNFTLDEDEEHPFIFNYNFEFIVTSLQGAETEIRGHYKSLPIPSFNEEEPIPDERGELELVADVFTTEPTQSLVAPRPIDDRTTQRLWEMKTGLPWSDALRYNLTDGTVQGNLNLRAQLYKKTWDPVKHIFV